MLLTTVAYCLSRPAKAPTPPAALPQDMCCSALSSQTSRSRTLVASSLLSGLILVLCIIGDVLARYCYLDITAYLAWAALGLDGLGGIVLYSLSSCGCLLCCQCAPRSAGPGCGRAAEAAAAVGFSVTFWIASLGLILTCAVNAQAWDAAANFSALRGAGYSASDLAVACKLTHYSILSAGARYPGRPYFISPYGLLSWGGLLAATALTLQGYFVTLVPEAVAAAHGDPSPAAAADYAAAARTTERIWQAGKIREIVPCLF